MKIYYFVMITGLWASLFSCSENLSTPDNQSANHASILVADEKDNTINQVNLSTGAVSALISSGVSSQPIDLKVLGKYVYILLSDTTSAVRQYDLTAGIWAGTLVFTNGGWAQQMTADGTNLYASFEGADKITGVSLNGLAVSGSKDMGQPVQGIFYTNGNIYACVSDGPSGYGNSELAVLTAGNISGDTPSSNTVQKNPLFLTTDGAGSFFISSAGTSNPVTYAYNGDGGLTKITGSTVSNIVTGKSFGTIQFAGGKIYAAENYNGIDVYQPDGTPVTNILSGININCMTLYNGFLYAEGNKNIYQIELSGNSISKTYANVVPDDSWGCTMDIYQ